MCFDDEARPPIPVAENSSAVGEEISLVAADGNRFAAFTAADREVPHAQVLILPDVRGLHDFYRELAMRFAENSIRALAIDYFGRTAGMGARDASFEYGPHVQQMTPETFDLDLDAAITYLESGEGLRLPTFVVGFCMGGSLALRAGMRSEKLAGVIAFYASLTRVMGAVTPAMDFAADIKVPVLGLFGGADQAIPVDDVNRFEQKLKDAGIENEIVIYPGAPHSFFDRRATDFATASADAWTRVQGFIQEHGAQRV